MTLKLARRFLDNLVAPETDQDNVRMFLIIFGIGIGEPVLSLLYVPFSALTLLVEWQVKYFAPFPKRFFLLLPGKVDTEYCSQSVCLSVCLCVCVSLCLCVCVTRQCLT